MRRTTILIPLLLSACSEGGGPPIVNSVEPNFGYANQVTTVQIRGDRFYTDVTIDLDNDGTAVDDEFIVTVGSAALENVTLLDVQTLEGDVPIGLALGPHTVSVTTPAGETGSLQEAFTVQEPIQEAVLTILSATAAAVGGGQEVSAGDDATLTVVVTNTGVVDAEQVNVSIIPIGATAEPSGTPPTDATLVAGGPSGGPPTSFVQQYTTTGSGELRFTVVAGGLDSDSLGNVFSTPVTSESLFVRRPTALVAALSVDDNLVSVGDAITVTMNVANNGEAGATNVAPSTLTESQGSLVSRTVGPSPATIAALAGGANGNFEWTYSTTAAGDIALSGDAGGSNALNDSAVTSPLASTPGVTIQTPPDLHLEMDGPTNVGVGQTGVLMSIIVTNNGQATAELSGEPTLSFSANAGEFAVTRTDGVTEVPGGGTQRVLTFRVDVQDPTVASGYVLDGQVLAQDANNGNSVSRTSADIIHTFNVIANDVPADLTITLDVISPTGAVDGTISTDQSFQVAAVVTNAGTCNPTSGSVVFDLGATGVTTSDSLTRTLQVGNSETLNLTAASTPQVQAPITAEVQGATTDSCMNSIPAVIPASLQLTTENEASLAVTANIDRPVEAVDGSVDPDTEFYLHVTVSNSGDAGLSANPEVDVDINATAVTLLNPPSRKTAAPGVPVEYNYRAPSTGTPQDDLVATIANVPDDENTNQAAALTSSSASIPFTTETVVLCESCASGCSDGTCCDYDCPTGTCPTCTNGCQNCYQTCGGQDCTATCDDGSSCTVDVTNSSNATFNCNAASCVFTCGGIDTSNCDANCDEGAHCSLTCDANVSNCRASCNGSSDCTLYCDPSNSSCSFLACHGTQKDCGGSIKICGFTQCP